MNNPNFYQILIIIITMYTLIIQLKIFKRYVKKIGWVLKFYQCHIKWERESNMYLKNKVKNIVNLKN